MPLKKQHAQLGMWLDGYDNLFSDFDSSPFAKRQISSDFITEAEKIFQEINPQHFHLNLFLPKKKRRTAIEKIITHRLNTVFKQHYHQYKKDLHHTLKVGFLVCIFGAIAMITTTTILHLEWNSFSSKLLVTFLEPSSWYAIWYGLDQIFIQSRQKKIALRFHYHLSQAKIIFQNY